MNVPGADEGIDDEPFNDWQIRPQNLPEFAKPPPIINKDINNVDLTRIAALRKLLRERYGGREHLQGVWISNTRSCPNFLLPEDLHEMLDSMGLKTTIHECRALISIVDAKGKNALNFSEFSSLVHTTNLPIKIDNDRLTAINNKTSYQLKLITRALADHSHEFAKEFSKVSAENEIVSSTSPSYSLSASPSRLTRAQFESVIRKFMPNMDKETLTWIWEAQFPANISLESTKQLQESIRLQMNTSSKPPAPVSPESKSMGIKVDRNGPPFTEEQALRRVRSNAVSTKLAAGGITRDELQLLQLDTIADQRTLDWREFCSSLAAYCHRRRPPTPPTTQPLHRAVQVMENLKEKVSDPSLGLKDLIMQPESPAVQLIASKLILDLPDKAAEGGSSIEDVKLKSINWMEAVRKDAFSCATTICTYLPPSRIVEALNGKNIVTRKELENVILKLMEELPAPSSTLNDIDQKENLDRSKKILQLSFKEISPDIQTRIMISPFDEAAVVDLWNNECEDPLSPPVRSDKSNMGQNVNVKRFQDELDEKNQNNYNTQMKVDQNGEKDENKENYPTLAVLHEAQNNEHNMNAQSKDNHNNASTLNDKQIDRNVDAHMHRMKQYFTGVPTSNQGLRFLPTVMPLSVNTNSQQSSLQKKSVSLFEAGTMKEVALMNSPELLKRMMENTCRDPRGYDHPLEGHGSSCGKLSDRPWEATSGSRHVQALLQTIVSNNQGEIRLKDALDKIYSSVFEGAGREFRIGAWMDGIEPYLRPLPPSVSKEDSLAVDHRDKSKFGAPTLEMIDAAERMKFAELVQNGKLLSEQKRHGLDLRKEAKQRVKDEIILLGPKAELKAAKVFEAFIEAFKLKAKTVGNCEKSSICFRNLDMNKDGYIHLDDLRAAAQKWNVRATEDELHALLAKVGGGLPAPPSPTRPLPFGAPKISEALNSSSAASVLPNKKNSSPRGWSDVATFSRNAPFATQQTMLDKMQARAYVHLRHEDLQNAFDPSECIDLSILYGNGKRTIDKSNLSYAAGYTPVDTSDEGGPKAPHASELNPLLCPMPLTVDHPDVSSKTRKVWVDWERKFNPLLEDGAPSNKLEYSSKNNPNDVRAVTTPSLSNSRRAFRSRRISGADATSQAANVILLPRNDNLDGNKSTICEGLGFENESFKNSAAGNSNLIAAAKRFGDNDETIADKKSFESQKRACQQVTMRIVGGIPTPWVPNRPRTTPSLYLSKGAKNKEDGFLTVRFPNARGEEDGPAQSGNIAPLNENEEDNFIKKSGANYFPSALERCALSNDPTDTVVNSVLSDPTLQKPFICPRRVMDARIQREFKTTWEQARLQGPAGRHDRTPYIDTRHLTQTFTEMSNTRNDRTEHQKMVDHSRMASTSHSAMVVGLLPSLCQALADSRLSKKNPSSSNKAAAIDWNDPATVDKINQHNKRIDKATKINSRYANESAVQHRETQIRKELDDSRVASKALQKFKFETRLQLMGA